MRPTAGRLRYEGYYRTCLGLQVKPVDLDGTDGRYPFGGGGVSCLRLSDIVIDRCRLSGLEFVDKSKELVSSGRRSRESCKFCMNCSYDDVFTSDNGFATNSSAYGTSGAATGG